MVMLPNLTNHVSGPFSVAGIGYLLVTAVVVLHLYRWPNDLWDRVSFWALGTALVSFTLLRPMGLARDDEPYVLIGNGICSFKECGSLLQSNRDFVWYGLVGLVKSFLPNWQSMMAVAAFALLIKLLAIDRLCRHRTIALLIMFPLIYIPYDFNQLRAGLALSFYFVAIWLLARGMRWLGGAATFLNFMFHSQAVFSPAILALRPLVQRWWIPPSLFAACVVLVYSRFVPSLKFVTSTLSLGGAEQYAGYTEPGWKPLALMYVVTLAYAGFLWFFSREQPSMLRSYVGSSLCLAAVLAWFFAEATVAQNRQFEFYIAPIVFLVGNMGRSRLVLMATVALCVLCYARLELLADWIMG